MAKEETAAYVSVPPASKAGGYEASGDGKGGVKAPVSWPMFFVFLGIFVVAYLILKKHAFSQILENLDARETTIRDSLDKAAEINQEYEQLEENTKAKINAAEQQARDILDQARKGGQENARVIERKAREEARIVLENAERDIKTQEGHARTQLKKDSADIAIALAEKIIRENLDNEKNRALTTRLIQEL